MSSQFIIRYAGAGVRLNSNTPELVSDDQADRYIAESDAWYAAYRAGLNPCNCAVVNLYEAAREAARGDARPTNATN